jgi:ABC-type multidrug transport system fused ATPase/permease subunit
MGFFVGLDSEGYDRQYSDRQLVERIGRYFAPHRAKLVWATVLLLVISVAGAATPVLVARTVDVMDQPVSSLGGVGDSMIWLLSAAVFAAGLLTWAPIWQRLNGDWRCCCWVFCR